MSLDFQFVESIDRKLIEYRKADGSLHWHPRAQSFVFYQMGLQFNLTGEKTTKKLEEIERRIKLMQYVERNRSHWYDFDGTGYQHQLADVHTYWGLETNCSHLNKTPWNNYFLRYAERCANIVPVRELQSSTELIVHEKPEERERIRKALNKDADPC